MNAKLAVVAAAALLFLLAAAVLAAPDVRVERWVAGGGGGHAQAATYSLGATIGQPLVGTGQQAPYQLASGFWAAAWPEDWIYVPLVLRDS